MATEKKFILKALSDFDVKEFLQHELERAGISRIQIQKTPVATRITLVVQRPGMVVGKRGTGIDELAASLKRFGIDNPKIEVVEVAVPSLDSKLMAEKIGRQIEVRGNVKQTIRMALREIVSAGAVGVEIRVAGKLVGKGGKAKTITMRQGFLKKSGEPMKLVNEAKFTAYPKAGAIGITVKILPPGAKLPDKLDVSNIKPKEEKKEVVETVEVTEETTEEKVVETMPKEEEKKETNEEKPKKARKKKEKVEEKAETAEKVDEKLEVVEPSIPEPTPATA